jgi:pyrroloquinoline-quinone synthase
LELFDRIESARQRWDVLRHPFYRRWSEGKLSREELSFYAGEYRHAVAALADCIDGAARSAAPAERSQLEEHAGEEAEHVALWDAFASSVGADTGRSPRRETLECVEAWTAGEDLLERLTVAYAIESAQPAIAATKLSGLLERYGFEEGPATEYFSLHAQLDSDHAAQSRDLIESAAPSPADEDRLVAAAESALRANWTLLDGVERAFGR